MGEYIYMNKSDFDYFMALYNTESISEAAMVCHTDKSTISKSIIKLEKDLNTKLSIEKMGGISRLGLAHI